MADAAVAGIIVHGEELPRAYVVLQESARGKVSGRALQDFVAGKVAKHKHLRGGVKFVDEVPKLASGKIVRKKLREWAEQDQAAVEAQTRARL